MVFIGVLHMVHWYAMEVRGGPFINSAFEECEPDSKFSVLAVPQLPEPNSESSEISSFLASSLRMSQLQSSPEFQRPLQSDGAQEKLSRHNADEPHHLEMLIGQVKVGEANQKSKTNKRSSQLTSLLTPLQQAPPSF